MNERVYIACDLGAESGRVIAGVLGGSKVALEPLHRFATPVLTGGTSIRWNADQIWHEILTGLTLAANRFGNRIRGISVDAWGVDYALCDQDGELLEQPYHYRDPRTAGIYDTIRSKLGEERIFQQTGIQFMPINTLYQLNAHALAGNAANRFLMLGDYFNYRLCSVAAVEQSSASTTQLYNPRTRDWAFDLIDDCGLDRTLFSRIVPGGSVLAPLKPQLSAQLGFANASPQVIATCTHDTAAAVVATPATDEAGWAFLSSGTWSLLGVELPSPVINADVRAANFTNEAGYRGTTRFLKNITGLWIIQQLRRAWSSSNDEVDYASLMNQAAVCEPLRTLIDPSHPSFALAGEMPQRITEYCHSSGEPLPRSKGEFVRCVLESLALLYGTTLKLAEELVGFPINRLHIVGGGSQSELLNQFTANAIGRRVIAGPVEATAIGNILIQSLALGDVKSVSQVRQIVRDSFSTKEFMPENAAAWHNAASRFAKIQTARGA